MFHFFEEAWLILSNFVVFVLHKSLDTLEFVLKIMHSMRVRLHGGLFIRSVRCGKLTCYPSSQDLCLCDMLDDQGNVVKTLTRYPSVPCIVNTKENAKKSMSNVMMILVEKANGEECLSSQHFMSLRMKGIYTTIPKTSELIDLAEAACGLKKNSLVRKITLVRNDFDEFVFKDEDYVIIY